MRSNNEILFHAYKVVTTCTEHGMVSAESNGLNCQHCDSKSNSELLGKLYQKRQLFVKGTKYKEFFNNFYLPALLKYHWHRFYMMILGKRHTGKTTDR